MSNVIKNIGGVTKEFVTQLVNEASLIKGVKRQYSDQFGIEGAEIGNILNVRYMDNPPIARGQQMVEQSVVTRTIPITILDINQYQASFRFTGQDLTMSVDNFTEKTNLKQTARAMIGAMEQDLSRVMMQFPQQVGTLGTTPGTAGGAGFLVSTAPNIYTNASAMLTAMGSPDGDRTMALTPVASGLSVSSLSGLQNPISEISQQYRKGRMGANTLGFDFIENMSLQTFTTGTRSQAGGSMNGNTLDGASTLNLTGLGANTTIANGEHFTIAGVRAVNPLNQQPVGFLQSFAVLADATADGNGNATVSISPSISLSNPETMVNGSLVRRYPNLPINVNGTVDALPLAGATVTFSGAASATGVFNVGFHKDSIVMTTVSLPMFKGADTMVQENYDGINVRLWKDADIKSGALYSRIDTIAVFTMIRSQLGVVVWG